MMKGKVKPKEKEEEPEMPTLRKRSVAKDKVEICLKFYHMISFIFMRQRRRKVITHFYIGGGEKA